MEKFIKALTKYEIPEWLLRQECVRKAKGKATHILSPTQMHKHAQWTSGKQSSGTWTMGKLHCSPPDRA